MRMYDIITKKRNDEMLTDEEIRFFVEGYTKDVIPDYQMAALLMAIYLRGMNKQETVALTRYMANSGDLVDLSSIPGVKVDKHSTGGVGDKTTMVIGPIVAACGVPVAKMSGRGLGHTGGTLDKLESISGFSTDITQEDFLEKIKENGICLMGQTGNIAPADKKIYALRDATATVENLPLIAASIMSKKIAAGSDAILLDVKTGNGAFMKTLEDAINLAQEMVSIGEEVGRKTVALITDMDRPLGYAIGNTLEVIEAVQTLEGNGPEDFTQVCIALASNMLYLAKQGELEQCKIKVLEVLKNGLALAKFKQMVVAQGGDVQLINDVQNFKKAKYHLEISVTQAGYIERMNTEQCGIASVILGAGRENKEDIIEYSAGIVLKKKIGDYVQQGEVIAVLYTDRENQLIEAEAMLLKAIQISDVEPKHTPLIHARVTKKGVEKFV